MLAGSILYVGGNVIVFTYIIKNTRRIKATEQKRKLFEICLISTVSENPKYHSVDISLKRSIKLHPLIFQSPIYRSVNILTNQSIHLSTHRSLNLSIYQLIYLSIYQFINLSRLYITIYQAYPFVVISTYYSINISTYQSLYL